jgi:hypothetical protein
MAATVVGMAGMDVGYRPADRELNLSQWSEEGHVRFVTAPPCLRKVMPSCLFPFRINRAAKSGVLARERKEQPWRLQRRTRNPKMRRTGEQ